jgi:hypothetical protein
MEIFGGAMRRRFCPVAAAVFAICSGQAAAGDPVKDAYAKEYAKALADYHAIDEKLERTLAWR